MRREEEEEEEEEKEGEDQMRGHNSIKRGISDRVLESPQENCVSVLSESERHDRARRLYNKINKSHESSNDLLGNRNSVRMSVGRSRRGGMRQSDNVDAMSIVSSLTSSTEDTKSSRTKKLVGRMKLRREYSKKKKMGRERSTKCTVVEESIDEDRQTMNQQSTPQVTNGFTEQHQTPHPNGYHPYMPHPYAHSHMPYYMPPPMQQPAPQIVISQAPGTWGYPGQQPGMMYPNMNADHEQQQKQYLEQQMINQKQQEIIRQQRELQLQQQEQLELQQLQLREQRQSQLDAFSVDKVPPPPPSYDPSLRSVDYDSSERIRRKSSRNSAGDHLFSPDFIDKLKCQIKDQATTLKSSTTPKGRVESVYSSESYVRDSTKSTSQQDSFSVGILGISDKSLLTETIGLLKKNSFSDKIRGNDDEEDVGERKRRTGMHGSFVEKTKDGLGNPSLSKHSQVLSKKNVSRLESRESLELDFNDVYSAGRKETFRQGDFGTSGRKSFSGKTAADSTMRHFAFENPNFSHHND